MKKFAVIGLGNFGFHAAKALFEDGNEVLAIDADHAKVQAIDPFTTEALVLNATDKEALTSLGMDEMDAVLVSTGTKISISIMICLYLNELGVRRIIAKALDMDHEKILRKVGATDIIHPERDVAIRLSRSLSRPNMLDFIPLSEDFNMAQVGAPTAFVGRSLKELNLRAKYSVHVLAVKQPPPQELILAPPADYVIRSGDILMILGKTDAVEKIMRLD